MSNSVVVIDAVRTPIGRYGGGLASVRPDDMAAATLEAIRARNVGVGDRIDEVYFGTTNGAGEENRNVARMAVLLAGLPTSTPAATVNRLCGSGMEAVLQAARTVGAGDAQLCVAGGVESMTRAPWVLEKEDRAYPRTDRTLHSTVIGWRMINPKMPEAWTIGMGEATELLADEGAIDRAAQDEFALRSHQKACAAWEAGRFEDEVVKGNWALDRDESIRTDASIDALARLAPAFDTGGTVTAGNSSPISDGASALLLADGDTAETLSLEPMARIAGMAVSGIDPPHFGLGPLEASARALERAGIGWDDLAVVELNEAFAAQVLACLHHWPIDPAIVNPNGGAIALGHPVGCSGARILTTLVWELKRRGGGYGLATLCIGVGQGIAVVVAA